ncbi:hypothetical protein [Microtetraspora sp. AC03309]|nr:hypothetical protein [Microtetraspora sp. AC03309]
MESIHATCPVVWLRYGEWDLICCKSKGHSGPHYDINVNEEWSE